MPYQRLMISVVSAAEAQAALLGGADIIDVKNPLEGALGAPAPLVVQEICAYLPPHTPLSVALGEFPAKSGAAALAALGACFFKPAYIKIPFLPSSSFAEIEHCLNAVQDALGLCGYISKPALVAGLYADLWGKSAGFGVKLISMLAQSGAQGCLLDTYNKNGFTLLDALSLDSLEQFCETCRQEGLFCALAGSLQKRDLPSIAGLRPQIIGLRGAVCHGGDRLLGSVSSAAVAEIKALLTTLQNLGE